jgi:hypothetical protein
MRAERGPGIQYQCITELRRALLKLYIIDILVVGITGLLSF